MFWDLRVKGLGAFCHSLSSLSGSVQTGKPKGHCNAVVVVLLLLLVPFVVVVVISTSGCPLKVRSAVGIIRSF